MGRSTFCTLTGQPFGFCSLLIYGIYTIYKKNVTSMTSAPRFFHTLQQQLPAAVAKLQDIDAEALARRSGFLARSST